jgi:histidyl-tRNA synthetase
MTTQKPKLTDPRRPRGLEDRGPASIEATRQMLETIRQVYERYGFEPVETPLIEYTDALGKFLPDQDRPNAGVFSFQDDDEQWLSLRYDLTAPLARYVAENFDRLPKPYRSYRVGPVFRNEKPGPGRFRQFMQFDADTVGAGGVAADAENCMMFADAMEALGIPRGSYVVKVNNRKVLDGVMEAIGIGGPEHAGTRLTVLRAIDKMDKFPVEEIRKLLGPGRLDESGDFTKGAGLSGKGIDELIGFLTADNILDNTPFSKYGGLLLPINWTRDQLIAKYGDRPNFYRQTHEGIDELRTIERIVRASGYGPDRIRIDPSVVRGLEYYTGPVYEVELTFEVAGDDGKPVRFGSVGGGGRYDGLIGRFRQDDVPATGISIGVSRLQAALTHLGKLTSTPPQGERPDRGVPADGQRAAAGGHPVGTLSGRLGLQGPDEVLRPPRRAAGHHPGRGRGRAGRGSDQGPREGRDRRRAGQGADGPRGVPAADGDRAVSREARGAGGGGAAGVGGIALFLLPREKVARGTRVG